MSLPLPDQIAFANSQKQSFPKLKKFFKPSNKNEEPLKRSGRGQTKFFTANPPFSSSFY